MELNWTGYLYCKNNILFVVTVDKLFTLSQYEQGNKINEDKMDEKYSTRDGGEKHIDFTTFVRNSNGIRSLAELKSER